MNGTSWDCTLCSQNNLFIEDSNCSAAAAKYVSDYGITGNTPPRTFIHTLNIYKNIVILNIYCLDEDPFSNYLETTATTLRLWHHELCALPLPEVPESCSCIAATTKYHNQYPSSVSFDAVYHYKVCSIFIFYLFSNN